MQKGRGRDGGDRCTSKEVGEPSKRVDLGAMPQVPSCTIELVPATKNESMD